MKVIHIAANDDSSNLPLIEPSAVAIGNFDGVHLGHQHILSQLNDCAVQFGWVSVVISFEPYPREFFAGSCDTQSSHESNDELKGRQNDTNHKTNKNSELAKHGFRLMSEAEKTLVLQEFNIDYLIIIHFDEALAAMSAEEFVELFLVKRLNTQSLYVGKDFRFGYQRLGDVTRLQEWASVYQYKMNVINDFQINNERVSSSLIRNLLRDNQLDKANQLLGRPHRFAGEVVHGDKRGREIGFATANIEVMQHKLLLTGVFAIRAKIVSDLESDENSEPTKRWIKGVCNLGFRPTYHTEKALLEVHLFDWNGDIYGKTLLVELIEKIRDEKKFNHFDELKQQIHNDALTAKIILGLA